MARRSSSNEGDLGEAEVQQKMDEDVAKGFHGVKVDPIPDAAYTLTTGPDSPSTYPDDRTRASQHGGGEA